MSFLKRNISSEITLALPLNATEAEKVKNDLIIILNKLNAEEINLLSRAVQNPIIKAGAVSKLKELL
jgi:hypothetical protein